MAAVGDGKHTEPGVQDGAPTASLSHSSLLCEMNCQGIEGGWVCEAPSAGPGA